MATKTVTPVVCLGCGCACDDISLTVKKDRISAAERACAVGRVWFGDGQVPARIRVRGSDVSLQAATARVVELLRAGPALVYIAPGLSTEAQRVAVALAESAGARLDSITSDPAPLTTAKVVKHKPTDAVDACWDATGKKIVEKATFDGKGTCNTLYPVHSEPRMMAGAGLTNDVLKCQLKKIHFGDYKASFNEAQKARLTAIFPTGVCDFSKPGVGQGPIKGTYQRY